MLYNCLGQEVGNNHQLKFCQDMGTNPWTSPAKHAISNDSQCSGPRLHISTQKTAFPYYHAGALIKREKWPLRSNQHHFLQHLGHPCRSPIQELNMLMLVYVIRSDKITAKKAKEEGESLPFFLPNYFYLNFYFYFHAYTIGWYISPLCDTYNLSPQRLIYFFVYTQYIIIQLPWILRA